jgi:hypothetical protein
VRLEGIYDLPDNQ